MIRISNACHSCWLLYCCFAALGAVLYLTPAFAQLRPRLVIEPAKDSPPAKTADGPAASTASSGGKSNADGRLEVRFTDNSVIKLTLKEERIAIVTKYGKLDIPVADIQRIEFALRIPDDMAKRIEAAVADLGHPQFRNRETASAILLGLREKAYPAVVKATKHMDTEIANRAEELVKKFEEAIPAALLKAREFDVIHTETSKIAGKIEADVLKAQTLQFGEVPLRLMDAFVLSAKSTEPEPDTANVAYGPASLYDHNNAIGKTFVFKVTGNLNGSVWGTDVYTTDSTLATVVVHAGLLQPGQTGIVKVSIVPSPNLFVGSTRNGVASSGYQQYPAAYQVQLNRAR